MNIHDFEKILGPKKAARLRHLAMEESPDSLYERIYGDCDDNEFTNEAVSVLCALAVGFYGVDVPVVS
jgi:hypothetical protein